MIPLAISLMAIVGLLYLAHWLMDCWQEAQTHIEYASRMSERQGGGIKGVPRPVSRAPGADAPASNASPPLPPGALPS